MNRNEETHKIYGYVTEDEFYAGLNEAKKENLFVDEKGWVDIGALLSGMWKAFGEGRVVVVPLKGFKRPEVKPETVLEMGPSTNPADYPVTDNISPEVPKKRTSRSKKAKEETTETVTE